MKLRAQIATLGGLLLLVAGADFAARVYVGRDASLRIFEAPSQQSLPPAEAVESIRARMGDWLPGLGGSAAGSQRPGQATALTLQGVFTSRGGTMAVISVAAPSAGSAETLRVAEGDEVAGWKVVRIERRSVTLEADDGTLQLVLFSRAEPMVVGSDRRVE